MRNPLQNFQHQTSLQQSAKVNWNTIRAEIDYNVEYKKGTTTWTTKTVSTNTGVKLLHGLLPSTKYEWRVKTNCIANPDIYSGYSVINTFTTTASFAGAMATAGITESSISEIKLFPNPAHNTLRFHLKLITQLLLYK